MALKLKRYKKEDIIVSLFMAVAILYPFFTGGLIFYEGVKRSSQERALMRETYKLLSGAEKCDREKAERISLFMSEELLARLGGVKGILRTCLKGSKSSAKLVDVEEEFLEEGKLFRLVATLKRREKGVAKEFKSVTVIAVEEDRGFRIIDVKISEL